MPTLQRSIVIAVFVLSLIARAQDKPPVKDKDFDLPESYFVVIQVVDKVSGEEMPNVTLSARIDGQTRAYATDGNGRANVEYPATVKYLTVSTKPPGLVGVTFTWSNSGKKDHPPETVKFEMEHGTRIGGTVADEAGKPVANADVEILFQKKNARSENSYESVNAKTDAQGKWSNDTIPADVSNIMIRMNHPDYLSGPGYDITGTAIAQLRAMASAVVMKKGVPLVGRVLDSDGKPISGATVSQGDKGGSNRPQTRTDAQGQFRFAQTRPGDRVLLTATAAGRAPEVKSVEIKEDEETEIRMEAGHTLKGQVLDANGNPVPKVWIAAEQWRGNRMLPLERKRIETDAQGRFVWNEAPADEVMFSILKQGYMSSRDMPLTASDLEQKITLRPVLHVTGTVIDAETKKPVSDFKAVQGTDYGNRSQIYWQERQPIATSAEGTFEFNITEPSPGHVVRIEAKNYLPSESRIFKDDEAAVSLEFALKKGKPIAGTLRTPDGNPLIGAEIAVCTSQGASYIRNGEFTRSGGSTVATKSDDAGRYELPPQLGLFSVVIIHQSSYAFIPGEQLEKSPDLTVQPWARVQGILRIGSAPAAKKQIEIHPMSGEGGVENEPRIMHQLTAITDKEGRFTIEHVPPGKASIALAIQMGQSQFGSTRTGYAQTQKIEVKPGETAEVTLGGTGRPVIGRITVPDELTGKFSWADSEATIRTRAAYPRTVLPENYDQMDKEARQKFFAELAKTPEYQAYTKAIETSKYFPIKLEPDGTFRCDDVPAGDFVLSVQLTEPGGNFRVYGGPLAHGSLEFSIPPMPSGRSDDPLDIGTIPVKPILRLKVGDIVPDVSLKTLDDKSLKISDFKGKHLVIHFWSAVYRPTPDDIPAIKAVSQTWSKDPRVVILGISNDQRIEWPQRFVAKNDIHWPQAFEGQSDEARPSRAWGINLTSTIVIIGPDGKLLAREVQLQALGSNLTKLLGQPQSK